jgi:periplasmic protein TonB
MSLAVAPKYEAPYPTGDLEQDQDEGVFGAQTLLRLDPPPPNYFARIGAILLYLGLLSAVVTVGFKTNETAVEEEQVVELAPIPTENPPAEDTPPPPEAVDIPDVPPPLALDPIAPVEEVKPVEKPKVEKPKVEKKVERAPDAPRKDSRPAPASTVAAPAVRAPAAPPGATTSAIANQFHACMQRAAANAYPEAQAPRTAHIAYRATFSPSGSLTSYAITPSGNGAFDAVANRLGSRCGAVAASGKPVALSGSLTFSP